MPVCPECSFWTPDFNQGEVDHNGTYVFSHSVGGSFFIVGSVTVAGRLGKTNGERSG